MSRIVFRPRMLAAWSMAFLTALPTLAQALDWEGFYAGGGIGYRWTDAKPASGSTGSAYEVDGITLDNFVGYNWQVGQTVFGTEAAFNIKSRSQEIAGGSKLRQSADGLVRLRAGWDFGQGLAFAAAGPTFSSSRLSLGANSDSENQVGWSLAAGVDVPITQRLFTRAEYRYSDFGTGSYRIGSVGQRLKVDESRAVFGVGLRF